MKPIFTSISVDFMAHDVVHNVLKTVVELSTSERTVKRQFFYAMPVNLAETDMVDFFNRARACAEAEAMALFEYDAPGSEGMLSPVKASPAYAAAMQPGTHPSEEDMAEAIMEPEPKPEPVKEKKAAAKKEKAEKPKPEVKKEEPKPEPEVEVDEFPEEETIPEPEKKPAKKEAKPKGVPYNRENPDHKKICAEIVTSVFGAGWTKDEAKKSAGIFLSDKMNGKMMLVDGKLSAEDFEKAKKVLNQKHKELTAK